MEQDIAHKPYVLTLNDPETGEVIAGAFAQRHDEHFELQFLFVEEDHRGKNLGERLVCAVEAHYAQEEGVNFGIIKAPDWQGVGFYDAKCGYVEEANYAITGGREYVYTKPAKSFPDASLSDQKIQIDGKPIEIRSVDEPSQQEQVMLYLIEKLDGVTAKAGKPEWTADALSRGAIAGEATWGCLHLSDIPDDEESEENVSASNVRDFGRLAQDKALTSAFAIAHSSKVDLADDFLQRSGFKALRPTGSDHTALFVYDASDHTL